MRQITTSKGKSYPVNYAWGPLPDGSCQIMMQDDRLLSQIAPEFEGLESIHFEDTETRPEDFIGFTVLSGISRDMRGVLIKLTKGAVDNA